MQRTEGALSSVKSLSLVSPNKSDKDAYRRIVNRPVSNVMSTLKFHFKEFLIRFGMKKQITSTYVIN